MPVRGEALMALWTADDLVAGKAALLSLMTSGKSVTFGDRSYTGHDLKDLRALIAEMEQQANPTAAPNYRLAGHRKGC